MATVVVVDDDEIGRLGRGAAIERLGHRAVAVTWGAAATGVAVAWADVDLVLAVLRPDRRRWDRYAAIGQVPALRSHAGPDVRIAAVLDADGFANELLGLRLHGAGIPEVLCHGQVADGTSMAACADGRLVGEPTRPTPAALARAGVGRRCDPSRVLERIEHLAADEPAFLQAFDPDRRQNQSGLSRRRAHTLRVRVADLGDLMPDRSRSAGGPERDQSLPRWTRMVDFVNRCRGLDLLDHGSLGDDLEVDPDRWPPVVDRVRYG